MHVVAIHSLSACIIIINFTVVVFTISGFISCLIIKSGKLLMINDQCTHRLHMDLNYQTCDEQVMSMTHGQYTTQYQGMV